MRQSSARSRGVGYIFLPKFSSDFFTSTSQNNHANSPPRCDHQRAIEALHCRLRSDFHAGTFSKVFEVCLSPLAMIPDSKTSPLSFLPLPAPRFNILLELAVSNHQGECKCGQ